MSSLPEAYQVAADDKLAFRRRMDRDPWLFSKYVCQPSRPQGSFVERIHRPLLYLYTRQASLLTSTLDGPRFDGEVASQVRDDLTRCGIGWCNPSDLSKVAARLRNVNVRLPRGSGKSTAADDADLWEACQDPNITIGIGSKADDYAEARLISIGRIVMGEAFAFWYPERVPKEPKIDVTQKAIRLGGRTAALVEATIEGRGITSQWTGRHYRKIRLDDIVGTESGQASVEDALRFIANIDAISVREAFGGTSVEFIGTSNGDGDDHSQLLSDPGVMSIVMPIERHSGGTTVENAYSEGELTMSEEGWFTRDAVTKIKERSRSNSKEGVIALLQNFYMVAHKSGTTVFTERALSRAELVRRYDSVLSREVLLRPKKGKESTERNPNHAKYEPKDWYVLDLKRLPATAFAWAADQSTSESGDEWVFDFGCMDSEGVIYLLDEEAGRGYDRLIDEILPFDRRVTQVSGVPCRKVGVDANATQGMTVEWLKRTPEFQRLARRIQPLHSNAQSKESQIRRWILGRMLVGDLYYDPRLTDFRREALRYRPRLGDGRVNRRAVDNRLDAAWMMCSLLQRPPLLAQIDEDAVYQAAADELAARSRSTLTGINTDNWMGSMWPSARSAA